MPVKARAVDEIEASSAMPGAYELVAAYSEPDRVAGMAFICPCGCEREGYLPLNGDGDPGPSWEWDGNKEAPTLTPSVQQIGGCRWHGWLTDGVWISC